MVVAWGKARGDHLHGIHNPSGGRNRLSKNPLPAPESTHVSHCCSVRGEPGGAAEARFAVEAVATVQPVEAMAPVGAKPETGEPAERIAPTVIRPVIVTGPTFGVV